MDKEYTKVVYKTKPIGREKIVLYLTTFDTKKVEKESKKDLPFWEDLKLSMKYFVFKKYDEKYNPDEGIYGSTDYHVSIKSEGWCYWGGRRDKE